MGQHRVGGAAGRATEPGERIANCQIECEEKERTPGSLASQESIYHKLEERGSLVIVSLSEERALLTSCWVCGISRKYPWGFLRTCFRGPCPVAFGNTKTALA